MLEARHLKREYKTKNGPTVHALDDVSVSFGETGMVFILGKSGSGKSTLLNVLGGLDKYDDGEVIVKGKSSKDFNQADFDSYRNTFIGFIFQEYNILDEFNVSKNIGLALELQGKKADKKSIDDLMEQVDLKGYGKRKPNTLSGGQKQRVAIARALVKNPEIIMADEPTGALDSNTGKQVFDTLKKLSKTKLVLVVSHDRDFAEIYGDRIIELADGKIISDISKYKSEPKVTSGLEIVDDKVLTIRKGTRLDKAKTEALIDFVLNSDEDIIISRENKANEEFKRFARIDEDGNKESFKNTEKVDKLEYDPKQLKLIRSKLPNKDAFKMGASGLKHKPFRLFLTILLSAASFAMFGLADTMGSYDKFGNTIRSIQDSHVDYASFSKSVIVDEGDYSYDRDTGLREEDITYLNNKLPELAFVPVNTFNNSSEISYSNSLYNGTTSWGSLYRSSFFGVVELTNANQSSIGELVAGTLPTADNEIVITKYTYESFHKYSYRNSENNEVKINSYSDLIDKTISIEGKTFTIKGIIDTHMNTDRYSKFDNENNNNGTITDYMLLEELNSLISTSYHALLYVNDGFVARNMASNGGFNRLDGGSIGGLVQEAKPGNSDYGNSYDYLGRLADFDASDLVWNGTPKTSLAENEVLLSYSALINGNGTQVQMDGVYIYLRDILYNPYEVERTHFTTKYAAKLTELELDINNSNEIINYYAAFDEYNHSMNSNPIWSGSSYGLSLSETQKAALDSFFRGYDFKCPDIGTYIKSLDNFESERLRRVDLGETVMDAETYRQVLQTYVENNVYSEIEYGSYSPLSDTEKAMITTAKKHLLSLVTLPESIWMKYSKPFDYSDTEYVQFSVVGVSVSSLTNSWSFGLVSDYLVNYYGEAIGGKYAFAISQLDSNNKGLVTKIVKFNYATHGDNKSIKYNLENTVMNSINSVNSLIESMAKVFLYIGIGFAVFAALLLLNFITISISYKKREIGILRAIGARGMDVFKIFFNEAFLIAFINFVIATIASASVCLYLNHMFRSDYGLLITLLNMGLRQIGLMFAMAVGVAFVSSFFPVLHVARKKPIDSIRNA